MCLFVPAILLEPLAELLSLFLCVTPTLTVSVHCSSVCDFRLLPVKPLSPVGPPTVSLEVDKKSTEILRDVTKVFVFPTIMFIYLYAVFVSTSVILMFVRLFAAEWQRRPRTIFPADSGRTHLSGVETRQAAVRSRQEGRRAGAVHRQLTGARHGGQSKHPHVAKLSKESCLIRTSS